MRILGLDIGTKKTGIALADMKADIVVAKKTLRHATEDELLEHVRLLAQELGVTHLAVGLPLLPQGAEGEQSTYVRAVAATLSRTLGLPLLFIDERYTSGSSPLCEDPDAVAACIIADQALNQLKKRH